MSALFNFPSLIVVILLFICSSTYLRALYPKIFDPVEAVDANGTPIPSHAIKHHGIRGFCWKASRVGERLSPYIGVCCVIMALHVLFF